MRRPVTGFASRAGISDSVGGIRAGARLSDEGTIRAAFDSLDLGFTFDDVIVWAAPVFQRVNDPRRSYAVRRARFAGAIAAAMITAVEIERARHTAGGER